MIRLQTLFYLMIMLSVSQSVWGIEKLYSIELQSKIDSVAELPSGGTVEVKPGIYIIGSVELKSGVTLYVSKGATLLGSINPYDYKGFAPEHQHDAMSADKQNRPLLALISSRDASNIRICGSGTIDGRGLELALAIDSLHHIGERIDPNYSTRRMRPSNRPKLLDFERVDNLNIQGINLRSSASWGVSLNDCNNVTISDIDFENRAYWNNDGIDIADCRNVLIERCTINSADDGIVLKSFNPDSSNDKIIIRDCDITSSASALKMGTESYGGFRNVDISNIRITDTFRSAIALESVYGAILENVRIDSVSAKNTGNAFFIRLGHRNGHKPGILRNVVISNFSCDIPFGRPDENYDIRGPEINVIHNPIPASITGIPDYQVENITLRNITVSYPGRGTKGMGYIGAYRYKDIPENIDSYPEFHMFGELPAWGLYVRHVNGLTLDNIHFTTKEPDYRPVMVVNDDVHNIRGHISTDK